MVSLFKIWKIYLHSVKAKRVFFVLVLLALGNTATRAQHIDLLKGRPASAFIYVNRGIALMMKGEYGTARANFDAAIREDPKMWGAYYNRALLSMEEHKWTLAVQDCDAAITVRPDWYAAAILRARANRCLGNYAKSLAEYDRIINFHSPGYFRILALNDRALIRAACPNASLRNGQEAIADAKKACELSQWKVADYVETLAAACAEAGDFDAAAGYEQQAIALDRKTKSLKYAERRLAMYRQHQPFRESGN
jgi:tetratricopeptide (TPR) repeat protein